EAIDFSLVYALHTFIANLEGQVCVMKGDALLLLDDANAYWWLVKCIKTEEIGYIPAENVETPYERLARLNRQRNVLATALPEHLPLDDYTDATHGGVSLAADMDEGRLVRFATMHTEICEITSGEASSDDGDGDARAADGGHAKHGEPTSTDPAAVADGAAPATPRNVLRVYAGNIDLKATFKSVEIRDDMTVGELLATAVKRFRVTNAANEYYLSVLHMDSQEKPLSEDQNIMVVLQTLRS
ncbi:hypothetical protein CXG81DRAFT_7542, partial [Caulochytrium protostelioides]